MSRRAEKANAVRSGGGSGAASTSPRLFSGSKLPAEKKKKPKFKLYDSGYHYCELLGVNVIAPVREADRLFWSTVQTCIDHSEIAKKYFLPLPAESYHLTMNNLFTENDDITAGDFENFIDENLVKFQKLQELLAGEQFKFIPTVVVDHVEVKKSITLSVKLPEDQREVIQAVFRRMASMEADFTFDRKELLLSLIPKKFHITLAYRYQEVAPEDRLAMEQLGKRILRLCMKKKMKLQPSQLCYFRSMEEFLPWDATRNPFKSRVECAIS